MLGKGRDIWSMYVNKQNKFEGSEDQSIMLDMEIWETFIGCMVHRVK